MSKKKNQAASESKSQIEGVARCTTEDLSLSHLNTTVMGFNGRVAAEGFRERQAVRDAKRAELKEKYGDDWPEHYDRWIGMEPPEDYDTDLKEINKGILLGMPVSISGNMAGSFYRRQLLQMRDVYGDAYDRLCRHIPNDPEVIGLLLRWAKRTGQWNELPDELQDAYHAGHTGDC